MSSYRDAIPLVFRNQVMIYMARTIFNIESTTSFDFCNLIIPDNDPFRVILKALHINKMNGMTLVLQDIILSDL
jgi:hypothetical protein